MRSRRPINNNSDTHTRPQQIVIRQPSTKPQYTWFDLVALSFLTLMVFFAVQSIAGMSTASFSTDVKRSLDAASGSTTIGLTSVASPIYHNLVASSTPPAPAEPVVVVVTATPFPTLQPTATAIQTPFVNFVYESPVDAARGHKCTEETPCSSRPQRPSEGRP